MAGNPLLPFFTGLPVELLNNLAQEVSSSDRPLALTSSSSTGPVIESDIAVSEINFSTKQFLRINASSAAIIQTLPLIKGTIIKAIAGVLVGIEEIGQGIYPVTITPTAPDLISGKTSYTLNPGSGCWLVCDGVTNWSILGLYDSRAGSIQHWGNTSIGAQAGTRYLSPGFTAQTATTNSIASWVAPRNGLLSRFNVRHNINAGNGNDVVYDIIVDGTPATLGLTLATGVVSSITDNVSVVLVTSGDLVEVTNTKSLSIGNSAVNVIFTCIYK